MTREKTVERIKVMQAFVDGKQIELKDCMGHWCIANNPSWDWESKREYHIKSESKYRPFANKDGCWQEMQKHQPFGWVKTDEGYEQIWHINKGDNFNATLKTCTFAGDTPFGIKDE